MQASDENKEKCQLGDYQLIQYQILQTNITRTMRQTVRRITNEILGVKGLSIFFFFFFFGFDLKVLLSSLWIKTKISTSWK